MFGLAEIKFERQLSGWKFSVHYIKIFCGFWIWMRIQKLISIFSSLSLIFCLTSLVPIFFRKGSIFSSMSYTFCISCFFSLSSAMEKFDLFWAIWFRIIRVCLYYLYTSYILLSPLFICLLCFSSWLVQTEIDNWIKLESSALLIENFLKK